MGLLPHIIVSALPATGRRMASSLVIPQFRAAFEYADPELQPSGLRKNDAMILRGPDMETYSQVKPQDS
jgi:hypothetical protein